MVKDAGDRFSEAFNINLKNGTVILSNSLDKSDQLDFYKIRLTRASNISVRLSNLKDGDNADLGIFDPDSNEIDVSENEENAGEIVRRLLPAGTYFIRVNRIDGDIKNYQLGISVFQDAGNSFSNAQLIRTSRSQLKGSFSNSGTVDNEDKFDFYKIRLFRRSKLTAILDGLQSNTDLTLFNSKEKRVAFSDNRGRNAESIEKTLGAGVYYVRVNRVTGNSNYRLNVSFE
jgi:Bacterial pre-peptidase C-terminal domain